MSMPLCWLLGSGRLTLRDEPRRAGSPRCTEIHPFAQMFLQRFGHREDVLAEIGNNLESFGSVGSLVPYYELRIALLRRLDAHEKPEVRDWSRRMRERFARILRRKAEFDQERELLL